MRQRQIAALLLLAGCSAEVAPSNPFDPGSPPSAQAKARVRGVLSAPSLATTEGLVVVLKTNGRLLEQTTAGAGGAFVVEVAPGGYALECAPAGFIPLVVPLTLAAGEDVDLGTLRLSLASASLIRGVATLADAAEHAGTVVEAVGRGFTTLTDSTGHYQLTVVAGTYTLQFSHESFLAQTTQNVTVGSGEEVELDPVALLANPAAVSGHVEAELDGGGFAPIENAFVTLEGTSNTGLTNPAGDFTLTGVQPGSYFLRVVADGYLGTATAVLDLVGGETRVILETLVLARERGAISGRVRLSDTSDASGVVVELDGGAAQVTGSSGDFLFTGLVTGSYEVSARKDGYARRVLGAAVEVEAGETTPLGEHILPRQGGEVSVLEGPYTRSRTIHLSMSASAATGFHASEDPAFADRARGDTATDPPRPYRAGEATDFVLSDADGLHEVHVVFFDGPNRGTPTAVQVVLDREPPRSPEVIIGSGSAFTNASLGIVSLFLSAQDLPPSGAPPATSVSGLDEMHLDARSDFATKLVLDYNRSATFTLDAATADGPKRVYARFVDHAGNVSATAAATVVLDRVAPGSPSIQLVGPPPAPAGFTASPVVTARLSAADANGGNGSSDLLVRLSNTSGLVGAIWQPFASEVSWVLTPGDGPGKTVYAQFCDPAGNESLVANGAITLRSTPPSAGLVIVEGGAPATSKRYPSLSISASGATQMHVLVDGQSDPRGWIAYADASSADLGTTEGTKLVSVLFRNAARLEGSGASAAIVYDKTAPASAKIKLAGSLGNGRSSFGPTATPAIVVQVTPDAKSDAVEMALVQGTICTAAFPGDPSWEPIARNAPFVLTGADGPKTVCGLFKDRAGNFNRADAASDTIVLDTTPPSNPIFLNLESGVTRLPTAPATGVLQISEILDNIVNPKLQCYGGQYSDAWSDCLDGLPAFVLKTNRENTLGIRARDNAYNVSPGTLVVVRHDDQPPAQGGIKLRGFLGNGESSTEMTAQREIVVTLTTPVNSQITQYTLAQGPAGTDCTSEFPDPELQPFTSPVSYNLNGQLGTRVVCALFADEAGNYDVKNAKTASIFVDTVPPDNPAFVDLVSGVTSELWVTGDATLVTDNLGAVVYQCLGGTEYPAWKDCDEGAPPFVYFLALDQDNTLGVRARDAAYNASQGSIVQISQDGAAPSPPVITDATGSPSSISLTWNESASADVVGYAVNYGLSPGNTAGTGAAQGPSPILVGLRDSFELTGLTSGTPYYVSVLAIDAAGNQSPPSGERLVVPNEINPRLISVVGGAIEALGFYDRYVYVGGHQTVIKLDAGVSDIANPALVARASMPNFVAHAGAPIPVVPCEYQGDSGECLYLTGRTLEAVAKDEFDTLRAEVAIVFFGSDNVGTVIGALPGDRALTARLAGIRLVTVNFDVVQAYSLDDPTNPVLVRKATFSSPVDRIRGGGPIGDAYYLIAERNGDTSLYSVASLAEGKQPPQNLGAVLDENTDPFGWTGRGASAGAVFTDNTDGVFYLTTPRIDGASDYGLIYSYQAPATTPTAVGRFYTYPSGSGAKINQFPAAWEANHIYVFDSGGAPQGWRITTSGAGFAGPGIEVPSMAGPSDVFFALAGNVRSLGARLFTTNGTQINRWSSGTSTVTAQEKGTFRQFPTDGTPIVAWGDYVFVARSHDNDGNSAAVFTVDVSNPRTARLVQTYTSPRKGIFQPRYTTLRARGGWLFAAATGSTGVGTTRGWVDIFQIGADGSLTFKAFARPNSTTDQEAFDIALSGKYLFVARSSTGLGIYDVSNPAAPINKGVFGTEDIDGVAASANVVYTTGLFGFQTHVWTGAALTRSSAILDWRQDGKYVSVHGPYAFVSDDVSTHVVDVSTPTAPVHATSPDQIYPLAGPVLFHSGYLIGPAPDGSGDGLRFVPFATNDGIDGSLPYADCTRSTSNGNRGQVAYAHGVYFATCNQNGLQIVSPVERTSGSLVYRNNVSDEWEEPSLATNGARLYMGGPAVGPISTSYNFWTGLSDAVPDGQFPVPVMITAPRAPNDFGSLHWHEGVLFAIAGYGPVVPSVDAYDTTTDGALQFLASGALTTGPGSFGWSTVDDGRFLYVPTYNGEMHIVDTASEPRLVVTTRDLMTAEFSGALAWYRGRLYAGADDAGSVSIRVWNVATLPGAPQAMTALSATKLPDGAAGLKSLTIASQFIFYGYTEGQSYGLGISKLSSAGDGGVGSALLHDFPSSAPVGEIILVGDVLLVRQNLSVLIYDVDDFWRSSGSAKPKLVGGSIIPEPNYDSYPAALYLDGPFAYIVGGGFRVFDLR